MKQLFILGLLMSLYSCQPQASQEKRTSDETAFAAEKQALLIQIESYYADMSRRDWEAYRQHFWDHAELITVWQAPGSASADMMVMPVDTFLAHTSEGPDSQPIFEEKMTHAGIHYTPGLAQVWAHYEAKFGTEDSLMEWNGVDAFTLLEFEGEWKISSLVYVGEE